MSFPCSEKSLSIPGLWPTCIYYERIGRVLIHHRSLCHWSLALQTYNYHCSCRASLLTEAHPCEQPAQSLHIHLFGWLI